MLGLVTARAARGLVLMLIVQVSLACSAAPEASPLLTSDAGAVPDGPPVLPPGTPGEGRATGSKCAEDSSHDWTTFAKPFMDRYCIRCHSRDRSGGARQAAPLGHDFDTLEGVLVEAAHIDRWAAAGPDSTNEVMPPEGPFPSRQERVELGEYLACAVRGARPGGPAGAPCWGLTQPLTDPQTPDEHACSAALGDSLDRVQRLFGRYATGSARIYRGTARAADNQDTVGRERGVLDGPVIAELGETPYGGGKTLRIVSPALRRYFEIRQPDASTTLFLSLVQDPAKHAGVEAKVSAAPVDLHGDPSILRFEVGGTAHYGTGELLAVTAAVDLQLAESSTVTARDVLDLFDDAIASGFEPSEGFWVRPVTLDASRSASDPPGLDFLSCSRFTTYRAEEYIRSDNLADFGVRNVSLVDTELCCSNCQAHCHDTPAGVPECFP
jgi:hypothetical protein